MVEAVRREAFVQGWIAARFPKDTHAMHILAALGDADAAYEAWRKTRTP
jgi:hypothetical protein